MSIRSRSPASSTPDSRRVGEKKPSSWASNRVPAATDIVVNATSVGLFPDVDARLDDGDALNAWTLQPASKRLTFANLHAGRAGRRGDG